MKLVFWAGLGVLLLAPASAGAISALWGRDVFLIVPEAPELVALNRGDWVKGQPVPPLYGTPIGPMRVIFPDESKIIVPMEDPALTLYKNERGDHPMQAQSLWFFARWAALAGLVMAAAGAAFSIN